MSSLKDPNRLGLGLTPCNNGERIVAIDSGGRAARAHVKVAVGDVLLEVGGCAASEAKAGLIAGTAALSTGKVWITILQPGRTEPTTIELPPLDASSMEMIDQTSDDDPLCEIPAALSDAVETQELAAAAASPQSAQTQPRQSETWGRDEQSPHEWNPLKERDERW